MPDPFNVIVMALIMPIRTNDKNHSLYKIRQ